MDKNHIPESFGVFKPVGHTVIAYRGSAALDAGLAALREQGFAPEALVRYTPDEMVSQADAEIAVAGALASMGQDLNLVKAQRELALTGCSFVVVHAPGSDEMARVDAALEASPAVAAQRYGHLIVEELIDTPAGTPQVAESPDRGLDLDTQAAPEKPAR
jgi:hypothetical protein